MLKAYKGHDVDIGGEDDNCTRMKMLKDRGTNGGYFCINVEEESLEM
jgi:hypothetical protein